MEVRGIARIDYPQPPKGALFRIIV